MSIILDLLKEDGLDAKNVSNGNCCSPCPGCGGKDRFQVWLEQERWWCRACGKSGDAIQYLIDFRGLNYFDALDALGSEPNFVIQPTVVTKESKTWQPRESSSPSELWLKKAQTLVGWAESQLWGMGGTDIRAWLHGARGLEDEAIQGAHLGWLPRDLWRERQDWGLPEGLREDGKPKKLWIPSGLVIPTFQDGELVRVRFRRPEGEPRYYILPGSSMTPMVITGADPVVVVESELDAFLLHQETKDLCSVLALGSAQIRPDRVAHAYLRQARKILVALDRDRAGVREAWGWWQAIYPVQFKRWPIVDGKDPCEAWRAGLDLQIWVQAGLEDGKVLGDEPGHRAEAPEHVAIINRQPFPYFRWQGEQLEGDILAFDTETSLIEDVNIPELAMASASSGAQHCLIHPDQIGAFILAHSDRHFVFHNVAFDFWVVVQHLQARGEEEALKSWWRMADENQMHDTMLLDMLVRLAQDDAQPIQRDLADVGKRYGGLEISKEDYYRKRYGEIIGKDWDTIEEGFFRYAVKDSIVTWHSYQGLQQKARAIMEKAKISPDIVNKYGFLSEAIQVKAAIVLDQVRHQGIHVDMAQVGPVCQSLKAKMAGIVLKLLNMPMCDGLFKLNKHTSQVILTEHGKPSMNQAVLCQILGEIAKELRVSIPHTEKGKVSVSTKAWKNFEDWHPFLKNWISLEETAKVAQFFDTLQEEIVHPRYNILVRSGRTSATDPNLQQIPRDGGVREVFVASPGHFLLAVDYSFIELRTLAAVCEARYGQSRLAEVIKEGIDPHCYTAALLRGLSMEDFMGLKQSDPERYKHDRQSAKAVNFGIPGGLGSKALVLYAQSTYGVELTEEEAKAFKTLLIEKVYPELSEYMSEDAMALLASSLGVNVEQCWQRFDWKGDKSSAVVGGIRRIVRGETCKSDGRPYSERYLTSICEGLAALNHNPDFTALLATRKGSKELYQRLFRANVATLTGRCRGGVSYTQVRNTPFQGLAADGAKLALWNLMKEGFRVVGFIHDEILIELPDKGGYVEESEVRKVEDIMCKSMEAITGSIPVACESTLSKKWSTEAGLDVRDGRVYPWDGEN